MKDILQRKYHCNYDLINFISIILRNKLIVNQWVANNNKFISESKNLLLFTTYWLSSYGELVNIWTNCYFLTLYCMPMIHSTVWCLSIIIDNLAIMLVLDKQHRLYRGSYLRKKLFLKVLNAGLKISLYVLIHQKIIP